MNNLCLIPTMQLRAAYPEPEPLHVDGDTHYQSLPTIILISCRGSDSDLDFALQCWRRCDGSAPTLTALTARLMDKSPSYLERV